MTNGALTIEVRHADRLCYAMQQSAVPWLLGVRLVNAGAEPLADLRVTLSLAPFLPEPCPLFAAAVPAGGAVDLELPDLPLAATALANAVELQRVDFVCAVDRGGEMVATTTRACTGSSSPNPTAIASPMSQATGSPGVAWSHCCTWSSRLSNSSWES